MTSSSNKAHQQPISQEQRDKAFAQMRYQNQNNICIDCQKKNPKWSSLYLGIHLCIDCAGKHRQYGVMYSFVKSTNMDNWNKKQLLFMKKGSNARALDYFKKCGIITDNNHHIDYKSPIVQKYKNILTAEVQAELQGKSLSISSQVKKQTKKEEDFFQSQENASKKPKIQLSEKVQEVKQQTKQKPNKKKKKPMAKKIDIADFQSIQFDGGINQEQKQRIIKNNETSSISGSSKNQKSTQESGQQSAHYHKQQQKQEKEQPRQLTQEEIKKKMQELKSNQNLKSISSDQFKDNSISNAKLKQNLNKFSNATSISSAAFFDGEDGTNDSGQNQNKFKEIVSNVGEKLSKLSSYWTNKS